MYKRILVPLDGSERSEAILPLVYVLARAYHADVILLRVVEYPAALYAACYQYPPADPDLAESIQNQKRALYDEVRDYLEQIASNPSVAGITVRTEVSERPVVEAILDSAEHFQVDLIAMSASSHRAAIHRAVGAVADRVLKETGVPAVLIQGGALPRAYFHSSLPVSLRHPAMT